MVAQAADPALRPWLAAIPWRVLLAILLLTGFGLVVLYSAAGGSLKPWALSQGLKFAVMFVWMLALSRLPMDFWLKNAWLIYFGVLALLFGVELVGVIKKGGGRWLDLGVLRLQPSELMKLAIVLVLARYYHQLPRPALRTIPALIPALLLTLVPGALVVVQPDLGTAMSIMAGGAIVMFLAGLPLRWFGLVALVGAITLPVAFNHLHGYQRKRVEIFLNPEADPLGAGYHITQSKIAIGSGGLFGKGFLNGSQSHLEYIPEHQTDFILATMMEEWGVAGGVFLLTCYGVVLAWGMSVAVTAKSIFARLTAGGLSCTLFFYVAINMLMVLGLAPVVGIPLPLFSYGGSAMLTVLTLVAILMSVARDRGRALVGGLAPAY
jgi:rod shape determining protein RodA